MGVLLQHFHTVNWAALGLAAGTVILTLLSRRFWPKGPAMLVGMLGMTAVSVAFTPRSHHRAGLRQPAEHIAHAIPPPYRVAQRGRADGARLYHRPAGGH